MLALVELMNRQLPAGVLTVVSGGREVGAATRGAPRHRQGHVHRLDRHRPRGSSRARPDNLARLTLELGGNDAGIVLPGTDPKAIAEDLFWGAFINTGQTCAALKRLYVHDYDLRRGRRRARRHGAGDADGQRAGRGQRARPAAEQAAVRHRRGLVEDARARGARIVTGGEPAPELGPLFYPATLVADIDNGEPLVDEEQFGPALPIIRYTDVDEAVAQGQRARAAWAPRSGAPTSPRPRGWPRGSRPAPSGSTSTAACNPLVPFGGVKGSGYGLEFGVEGLKAVAVPQVING